MIDIRPDWNSYFLGLAFIVSTRSRDAETQHGAVIVDNNNLILGTGYNSFIKGIDDTRMPAIRPNKYPYMIHAEQNAIFNCRVLPREAGGGRIYITGTPCNHCLQSLIQVGIKKIYIADRQGTALENEETKTIQQKILTLSNAEVITLKNIDFSWMKILAEKLV